MENKKQASDLFETYKSEIENKKEMGIKIRTSYRGEIFPLDFLSIMREIGLYIKLMLLIPQPKNGLTERKIKYC